VFGDRFSAPISLGFLPNSSLLFDVALSRRGGNVFFVQGIDMCRPGTFSANGFSPCIPCSVSYYQPSLQATTCVACPAGSYSLVTGATSSDVCLGIHRHFAWGANQLNFLAPGAFSLTSSSEISLLRYVPLHSVAIGDGFVHFVLGISLVITN
jgi:hypothetical protein